MKALFSHRKWLRSHTYSIGRHPMNRSPDFRRQMFNDLIVSTTIANDRLVWFWTCSKKSITVTFTCPITRGKMIDPYIDRVKAAKPRSSLTWILMKSLRKTHSSPMLHSLSTKKSSASTGSIPIILASFLRIPILVLR